MNKKIRVSICDDAKFLCDGFFEQFLEFSDIESAGAAYCAADCLPMLDKHPTDILLLDIRMETETAGLDIISEIKDNYPELKIIILTSFNDDDYIFSAFANGADDYCEKTESIDNIINTIRMVYNNTGSLRPEIAKKLVQRTKQIQQNQYSLLYLYNKISQLSNGEYELLREMYYGSNYKKIAADKFVEVESVRKMAKRVLKRMEAKSMQELIKQIQDLKLFEFIDSSE